MTNSNMQNLISQAAELSYEDLIALNKAIVALARQKHRATSAVVTSRFVPGQIVRFFKRGSGRHAGMHYIRVTGYNRAGTCVIGMEVSPSGAPLANSVKWTVDSTSIDTSYVAK